MLNGISDQKLKELLEENLTLTDDTICNKLNYIQDIYEEKNKENLLKLVSNLDKPIFFFKNQGILTGAFGSKYSRTSENMRPIIQKLMNEESKSDGFMQLNIPDDINLFGHEFFERVYSEYGDDSIAQMVPLTVGFEQISMLYAMSLFHHRLLAGIEKSTRYKEFDKKINGKYQYYTPNEFEKAGLKEEFERVTNNLFDIYSQAINKKKDMGKKVYEALTQKILPKELFRSEVEKAVKERGWESATDEELDKAYDKTIRAMHIDNVRHILPLATRTSLALQLNAQSLREVIMSSYATPTTESVVLSEILRREGEKFVGPLIKDLNLLSKDEKDRQRAEDYINFKHETRKVGIENYNKIKVSNNCKLVREGSDKEFSFELKAYSFEEKPLHFVTKENREEHFVSVKDPNSDFEANIALKMSSVEIIKAILKEGNPSAGYADIENYVRNLSIDEMKKITYEYAGITNGLRKNRRHKPGRAFENANFDISIKIPVGEIRDLRRHRILTIYDPGFFDNKLSYYISQALKISGCEEIVKKAYEEAGKFYEKASKETNPFVASYVLPFATYSWMNMTVNLRELHHMLELRTQPGAHGNYKKICQMIYAGLKARSPFIGETMKFIDKSTEIDYGRALQELRTFRKQKK